MLWWLLQNTVGAAVLAGLVALICGLVRPRPAVRHALWLIVLVKLLAPPLVSWPWIPWEIGRTVSQWLAPNPAMIADPQDHLATSRSEPPPNPAEFQIVLIPVNPPEESLPAIPEPDRAETLEVSVPENADRGAVPGNKLEIRNSKPETPSFVFRISNFEFQIIDLMVKLWFAGALGAVLWQTWRLWRFRRQLTRAEPPPEWLCREVAELSALLHVRMPRIAVLPGIASPLVWGLGPARLVWPAELSKCLSAPSRRSVLLHELAHLRRRDHWVAWLQLVGSCLYWWNPLFWFVVRQVRENAELACDAWVVAMLPDARRAFAEALIEVAQFISSKVAPLPALGLGSGRRRDFERRLLMIMCAGVPCKLSVRGLVVVGLLALTALPGWSIGQQETEKPKAPAAPVTVPPPPALATPEAQVPPPVVAEVPPPAFVAAPYSAFAGFSAPGQNDPEGRLKAIEDQLQVLLKEVRGMRKGGPAKAATPAISAPQYFPPPYVSAVPATAPVGQNAYPPAPAPRGDGAISLTRAIYDLPAAKAKALSGLLQDSKGPVVEMKAEGDKVTVTTTPEAQQIIGQLIVMLQGKARSPRATYDLPAAKAKALADLLQDWKGPVVEMAIEDDKVTVTTTPEAQQIIGQLIAMLQGKARVHVPRTSYQYHAVPVTTYEAVPATR
jgi:beta-lactamase regulating signal transducer with metallopeptidase domain